MKYKAFNGIASEYSSCHISKTNPITPYNNTIIHTLANYSSNIAKSLSTTPDVSPVVIQDPSSDR